jgi:flavoprotein
VHVLCDKHIIVDCKNADLAQKKISYFANTEKLVQNVLLPMYEKKNDEHYIRWYHLKTQIRASMVQYPEIIHLSQEFYFTSVKGQLIPKCFDKFMLVSRQSAYKDRQIVGY